MTSIGISGCFRLESVDGLPRNTQAAWSGLNSQQGGSSECCRFSGLIRRTGISSGLGRVSMSHKIRVTFTRNAVADRAGMAAIDQTSIEIQFMFPKTQT